MLQKEVRPGRSRSHESIALIGSFETNRKKIITGKNCVKNELARVYAFDLWFIGGLFIFLRMLSSGQLLSESSQVVASSLAHSLPLPSPPPPSQLAENFVRYPVIYEHQRNQ